MIPYQLERRPARRVPPHSAQPQFPQPLFAFCWRARPAAAAAKRWRTSTKSRRGSGPSSPPTHPPIKQSQANLKFKDDKHSNKQKNKTKLKHCSLTSHIVAPLCRHESRDFRLVQRLRTYKTIYLISQKNLYFFTDPKHGPARDSMDPGP